jgi:nitroreductase
MLEIFKKRHSVRSFQSREVEDEKIKEILEAGNSAPSAGNLKAREIVVVKDLETKKALAKAALGQSFVAEAPMVLVFFALPEKSGKKYEERGRNLYSIQDATISASFAWLQAVDLGLSACWVGAFDDEKVKEVLKVSPDWHPIAILPIGYSAE